MSADNERELSRDVEVTVIPSGEAASLPAGTRVTITHRLGGNFTIVCDFGMFRVPGKDADALNEEVPEEAKQLSENTRTEGPPEQDELWESLKTVYDPEIPVNIVDLGLIYSLDVNALEAEADTYKVNVAMTLTAPGCGMGPAIAEDARSRLVQIPGVREAQVDIVWEPPWHQDMISEEGKMQLGLI